MSETTRIAAALADRYVIEREIGAGGMATVYLARDRKHDRDVALKILRADLSAVLGGDRFLNEVRITARLDHPHILTLIDSGEADGIYYYVLPLVRGESLRAKLDREKQLGIEEALSITRQVASALDYAHGQGVVHRDIKPENILLHEGEAMLADFGIALAVKEAGGNRLTETGLSLGTPQYMSPEQATGDRTLDARSDVYSLAAVTYEMLAGEAPVTGATAQAMIAKLMTERPTRLRVVRDTVPEGIDSAVAKALAKVPADRFPSAGAFVAELQAAVRPSRGSRVPADRRMAVALWVTAAIAAVALVLLFVLPLTRDAHPELRARATLRDRRQLTFNGRVTLPAISGDGKQLAYVVSSCAADGCRYGIELQDVGGTATRRLFDGATAIYDVFWSPDRRHLIFAGSVGNRFGSWLLSTIGAPPRHLSTADAVFFAGGDSVLISRASNRPDSVHWIQVAALDGVVRDSIRIAAQASYAGVLGVIGKWIVVGIREPQTTLLAVDRQGVIAARHPLQVVSSNTTPTSNAIFAGIGIPGVSQPVIVRLDFDSATGAFGTRHDTIYTGDVTRYDVTDDGAQFVVDEGSSQFTSYVVDTRELLRGELPDERRLSQSTAPIRNYLSPDARRVMTLSPSGERMTVQVLAGGPETTVPLTGTREVSFWADSVRIALAEKLPAGTRLSLVDVRSGARSAVLQLDESEVNDMTPLPGGGWAWIPDGSLSVKVQRSGDRAARVIPRPDWFIALFSITTVGDPGKIAIAGWDARTNDTLGLAVIDLGSGAMTMWTTALGEDALLMRQRDGSVVFGIAKTLESMWLQRVRGPGRIEVLGTIPRPIWRITLSDDARRAAVVVRQRHGDVWMSRVTR